MALAASMTMMLFFIIVSPPIFCGLIGFFKNQRLVTLTDSDQPGRKTTFFLQGSPPPMSSTGQVSARAINVSIESG
ncbi:hypothetical protein [Massilia oculi]|uniref:hypothetical protein n=1 Tax=Massilia oculi TaxID=945844 RepID=UPI0028AA8972|nr:hypothetical protein [Massilia oculi]